MRVNFCMVAVFAAFIIVTGCNSRNRDFKAEQEAYETHKKEKEAEQGKAFSKIQEALRQKIEKISTITTLAESMSYDDDSTFVLAGDTIRFLSPFNGRPYMATSQKDKSGKKANAIVINTPPPAAGETPGKNGVSYLNTRLIDRLNICYRDSFFVDCYKISEPHLNEFMGVRYLFVVDEILYAKPKLSEGSSQFQGGAYLAAVYVFDLEDKSGELKPLCTFPVMGQNSESIQVHKYMPEEMKLNSDLQKNCFEAFNSQCAKHFAMAAPLESLSSFF